MKNILPFWIFYNGYKIQKDNGQMAFPACMFVEIDYSGVSMAPPKHADPKWTHRYDRLFWRFYIRS